MKLRLLRSPVGEARAGCERRGLWRSRHKLRSAAESAVLAGLLLTVVAATLTGSFAALSCAVVGAWIALAVIVGPRNVLDAGCAFMLLVVGIVLISDLASNGPASLLP